MLLRCRPCGVPASGARRPTVKALSGYRPNVTAKKEKAPKAPTKPMPKSEDDDAVDIDAVLNNKAAMEQMRLDLVQKMARQHEGAMKATGVVMDDAQNEGATSSTAVASASRSRDVQQGVWCRMQQRCTTHATLDTMHACHHM